MDQYRKNRGKVRTRAEGVLKPPQVGENGGTRWAQCWTNCVCILVLLEQFSRSYRGEKPLKKLRT